MISLYTVNIDEIEDEGYIKEYNLISSEDKKQVDRYKAPRDIKSSIAWRILLRRGVKELFDITDYTITYSENGKPMLPFCFFSVSHSGGMVACAISEKDIGIDIEKIKKIKRRESYHFFNLQENSYVNSDKTDIDKRFLEIWTRKEAYLKCFDVSSGQLSDISVLEENETFSFNTYIKDGYVISVCENKV